MYRITVKALKMWWELIYPLRVTVAFLGILVVIFLPVLIGCITIDGPASDATVNLVWGIQIFWVFTCVIGFTAYKAGTWPDFDNDYDGFWR